MNSCEMLSSCQALNKLSVIVRYFTQDKQLVKENENNRVGPGQNKIGSEAESYKSSLETQQLDVLVCKGQSWFTPGCPASLLTVPVQTQSCATQMPTQGRACAFRATSAFAPKSSWATTEQGDSTGLPSHSQHRALPMLSSFSKAPCWTGRDSGGSES